MAEKPQKSNENRIRKIDFLKTIGSNPDRKAVDIGQKEFGMSQSSVYNAINEFILNCIWSDDEGDYPKRVLNFYNKEVPNPDEQLTVQDIEMNRHYVDEYYEKHLPGGNLSKGKEAVHTDEVYVPAEIGPTTQIPPQQQQQQQEYNQPQQTYNRMTAQQPFFNQQEYQKRDLSSDAGYLRTILEQGKYVHPSLIDRFMKQYDLNKEIWDRDPLALLGYMKHMFSSAQGEEIWKIFQKGKGKFVPQDALAGGGQQMDPMQLFMMMQMMNGGMNPQMMPMMQQMMGQNQAGNYGGGNSGMDMNQMMMMLMMSQMGQKSQKDQQKQDMNELFEKMIQAIMLKMVGGAAEDRKPWDMYGMYGGMGMMPGMMGPPQIQEVMDPSGSGRVTQRNIVPNFGMPGMHGANQPDPVLMSVLNNTMSTNTQLLMKITDSGKPITDILLGMIPYFKDSGNSALQLSNMFKTMNEMVPGFFGGNRQEGQNIEIAKLKLDTDLALAAQNMELQKMQHTWRIDEMDRKSNQENASNWMRMIESLGGSFSDKIAPALLEGFGKGGLVGPKGQQQQQQQMDPMQAQMRMQQAAMKRQQEMEQRHEMRQQQQEKEQQTQQQINQMQEQQQMTQQQAMFAIGQLQSAVAQRDQYIQNLTRQMQDIQNQPTQRYQQGGKGGQQQEVNEQQLLRMGSGELQQMLREINHSNMMESSLKSRIETILANRSIMDQSAPPPSNEPQEPQQSAYEPGTETEDVSSVDTREFEERHAEG